MSRILITGASSGIGYELAKISAKHGHDLILVARSTIDTSPRVFSKVNVITISADLSKPDAALHLYNQVSRRKLAVDILVNNAGFGDTGDFSAASRDRMSDMIHVNCITLTELSRLYVPEFIKNKSGKIVNIASTASFVPGPLMAVYYATKHYVLALSEALSEELRGTGVSVTAICPGPTKTGFAKAASADGMSLFNSDNLPTSKEVAQFAYDNMMNGRVIAVHGWKNKVVAQLPRILPRWVVRRAVHRFVNE